MQIPTISVIYLSRPKFGLVDINESDFDPKLHALPDAVKVPRKRGRPRKTEQENANS
jgi:hypothetical protein